MPKKNFKKSLQRHKYLAKKHDTKKNYFKSFYHKLCSQNMQETGKVLTKEQKRAHYRYSKQTMNGSNAL